MNQQLTELAAQARNHARQYVADCRTYGYYMEYNEEQVQFEQKFAELIIKECAEIAHCNFHVDGLTLGGILKEHFGVEE